MRLTRSSLPLLLAACVVDSEPMGNRCDDTHPCKSGEVCVAGECVIEGAGGGATAGGGGGVAGGGATAGGGTAGSGGGLGAFAIVYVDATNGDDSNPGTQAQPWKTLAKVNATPLPPGATVRLKGGQTWEEPLVPLTNGNLNAPSTIESYGGGRAVISGRNASAAAGYGIGLIGRSDVTFRDLEVVGFAQGFAVYLSGVSNVRFERVELHDCVEGLHPSPTAACDRITVVDSSIHHMTSVPGFTNPFAINIPSNCTQVTVADSGMSFTEKNCVTDNSPGALYQHVDVHDCGSNGIQLRNAGSAIRDARIANTFASCIELQTDGGIVIEASQLSGCTNGVRTDVSATGRIDVRRNRIWDVNFGVTMTTGAVVDLRISNNAVLGGRLDGGNTQWAFNARRGGTLALENNVATGGFVAALSVLGVDGGTLPDGGRFVPGFIERGNALDLTQAQLSWDRPVTSAEYLMISGQGAGTWFSDPELISANRSAPDFHLKNGTMVRDRGVPNPATGPLTYGCDGGLTTFCGLAPDPGVFELIP